MELVFSAPSVQAGWDANKEFVNFGPRPMKFESKQSLSRYCKEKKLRSAALL